MGLLDMLTTNGSVLSYNDGNTPSTNQLATNQSTLHANAAGLPGYSLNGAFGNQTTALLNSYEDGITNAAPQPSTLDLNGVTPPQYLLNAPEVGGPTGLTNNYVATPFGI